MRPELLLVYHIDGQIDRRRSDRSLNGLGCLWKMLWSGVQVGEEAGENQEKWRYAPGKRGMKVRHRKTENICAKENEEGISGVEG